MYLLTLGAKIWKLILWLEALWIQSSLSIFAQKHLRKWEDTYFIFLNKCLCIYVLEWWLRPLLGRIINLPKFSANSRPYFLLLLLLFLTTQFFPFFLKFFPFLRHLHFPRSFFNVSFLFCHGSTWLNLAQLGFGDFPKPMHLSLLIICLRVP